MAGAAQRATSSHMACMPPRHTWSMLLLEHLGQQGRADTAQSDVRCQPSCTRRRRQHRVHTGGLAVHAAL